MKSHSTEKMAPLHATQPERISALMDGELESQQLAQTLEDLCQDSARDTWQTYHLIGDVLRNNDLAQPLVKSTEDILMAINAEPPMIVRRKTLDARALLTHRILPAGAAVAAVVMVGWMVWPQITTRLPTQTVARSNGLTPTMASVETRTPRVIPDMAEMLTAHRQFSPYAASYGVASVARNGEPEMVIEVSASKE
ncbi:MAG: hypothetical protein EPO06_02670 [Burkholderiaceae bacterium]|nr:MAG: hypothetical protein EPO06_02670 [Burkholderiaceae bacterium]